MFITKMKGYLSSGSPLSQFRKSIVLKYQKMVVLNIIFLQSTYFAVQRFVHLLHAINYLLGYCIVKCLNKT